MKGGVNNKRKSKSPYKCKHCNKVFSYESDRKRHELSHAPQFSCDICSKNFSYLSALSRHIKQHGRKETARCDKCGGNFRDKTLLVRHMKYAHTGTYPCPICKAIFNSEQAIKTHMKTHNAKSERRYKCGYSGCTKAFNFSHHLKHHELTHTSSKQFQCDVCKKGFIQYHHLRNHLKIHGKGTRLSCTVENCSKKFTTEYARKRHLKTHKNLSPSSIEPENNNLNWLNNMEADNFEATGNKSYDEFLEDYVISKREATNTSISNCKNVLGDCLVSGDCLCAHMSDYIEEDYNDLLVPTQFSSPRNDIHRSFDTIVYNSLDKVMPELEHRSDGIIKLKETLDVDIFRSENKNCESKSDWEGEIIPFNSCKAILGKCIVSADGKVGAGCLCAKMSAREQPIDSQEIDEITPHPFQ